MTHAITAAPSAIPVPYADPDLITALPVATAHTAEGYTSPQPASAITDPNALLALVQDLPCSGWVGVRHMEKGGPLHGTSAAPVPLNDTLKAQVTAAQQPYNLGIVAGDGLIVVDCDTAADVDYFKRLCFALTGVVPSVTMTTPGVQAEDGTAKPGHTGGAHFYLRCIKQRGPWGNKFYGYPAEYYDKDGKCTLPAKITKKPDKDDPSRATEDNPDGRTGLDVRFHGAYTLCPPSQRAEGRYVPHVTADGRLAVTDVYPAFIERLLHYTGYRAEVPSLVPCPSDLIGHTPALVPGDDVWTADLCHAASCFGEALGEQLWAYTHPEDTTATITGYDGTKYAPSEINAAYPGYFESPMTYAAAQGGLLAAADVVIPAEPPATRRRERVAKAKATDTPAAILRAADAAERDALNDPEDRFYIRVTDWAELLEQWDYTRYHKDSACGCELWCRPGGASEYQMICHTEDCAEGLKFGYSYSPHVPDEWREFARRDDGGVLVTKIDLLYASVGTEAGSRAITDTYAHCLPGFASPTATATAEEARLAAAVGDAAARRIMDAVYAASDSLPTAEDEDTPTAQQQPEAVDTTPASVAAPAAQPEAVDTTTPTAQPEAVDTTPAGAPTTPAPVAPILHDDDAAEDEEDAITILMRDFDPAGTIQPRPGGCRVYNPEGTARTGIGSVALTTAQVDTVLEIITAARDYLGTGDPGTVALYGDTTPIPPRLVHTVAKAVAAGESAPSDREIFPDGPPNDLALINRIMKFSPVTRAIYTHSTGAGGKVHPVAAYMHQLVLTCMRIPPYLRTPTGNDSHKKPINIYLQLMGPSGAGKSVTMAQQWLWARCGETRAWFNERADDNDCTIMQEQYLNKVAPNMDAERESDFIRPSRDGEESAHITNTRHRPGPYTGPKKVNYDTDTQEAPDLSRYIEANSDAAVPDPLVHTKCITVTHEAEDEDGNVTTTEEVKEFPGIRPRAVALARYDEMGKVFNKNGSSPVLDELAKAWSGTGLGGTTQGHGNKQVEGLYSYCLEGGVQPSLLAEFGNPAAMRGFMQRQFFCYARWPFGSLDIGIPPQDTLPPSPLDTTPDLKPFTAVPAVAQAADAEALNGEEVNAVNQDEEIIWLRGVPKHVKAMMSHTTLMAVRLACAVAAIHGTSHVSEAIWAHVLDLMEFHRRTLRAFVAQGEALAKADRAKNGELAGASDVAREDYKRNAAAAMGKHKEAVLEILTAKHGKWVSESQLLRGLRHGTQGYAQRTAALKSLAERGTILAEDNPHPRATGLRYKYA
ncbi:bifunctional DNA primase/polymerase [Corynebacterium aurimucosum]|nr:bifunctional DNA primase/polymerase [Corynebacterium aurimucosum]NJJ82026.1 hypothetical protein [Corynebacterium aurimucosum]